jgi:hypothetical protein
VNIKAPVHISKRVELLVNRKKDGIITYDEIMELERFLALNMLISLAKARARVLLQHEKKSLITVVNTAKFTKKICIWLMK